MDRARRLASRPLAALLGLALAAALAGCSDGGGDRAPGPHAVSYSDPVQVAPSSSLPGEVVSQRSHNNLDIVDFEGRLFFVFRTAPTHFASPEVVMWVVSSPDDGVTWDFETRIAAGTDVREPRFFAWHGALHLFYTELGSNVTNFEPGQMKRIRYEGPGRWTAPESILEPGFIPWRIKVFDNAALTDTPLMVGYTGGENIYDFNGELLEVYLLTTHDGLTWVPLDPARPVVLESGASETDVEFDDEGNLFAIMRNEAGDETGFGSKVCTAPRDDLTSWTCNTDPRKYDSPLMLKVGSELYVVGRRNVTETGNYDLGRTGLPQVLQLATYQLDYWTNPKRCSVWYYDREALAIDFLIDLPSAGDTCFPSALPRGRGEFLLYNYTSPLDGPPDAPDPFWLQGQLGDTLIYSSTLRFD